MFRQIDALALGKQLLEQHGLKAEGWEIQFNKSPSTLGQCWHQHKAIALSTVMLNSVEPAQVKDCLLHEIAHALVGPGHFHDDVWKAKAQEIGCTGEQCGRSGFNPAAALRIEPSQVAERKSILMPHKRCPKCNQPAKIQSSAKIGEKEFVHLTCNHTVQAKDLVGRTFEDLTSETGKKLYNYQLIGAQFILESGGRCLLADQPGLGKTAQVIAPVVLLPEIFSPILHVTKSKLKIQAAKEWYDWGGAGFFPCMIDTTRSFILPGFKVYVISMDLLRRMSTEKLDSIGIKTILFDEVQHISNPVAARTVEVKRIVAKVPYFLALSGGPWKNNSREYFPTLNMLAPEIFRSMKSYEERWVDWYSAPNGKSKPGGIRNIPKFRELTKHFIIRRLRDEVMPDLPKTNRQLEYVEIEDIFAAAYERAESTFAQKVKDQILEGKENFGALQDDIMLLRHIVGLAKVDSVVEWITDWLQNAESWEKLTVFHHHIDVGDQLEKRLNAVLAERGELNTLRIKGGMSGFDSNRILEKFKMEEKRRILIGSTLASGEGLNIQFCQNALMMERQWNAKNEEQAELRFSRPLNWNDYPPYLQEQLFDELKNPKTVSIRIPYFICANTVDELITEIVERKRHNNDKSMNPGQEDMKWDDNEIMAELVKYIMKKRYGKVA